MDVLTESGTIYRFEGHTVTRYRDEPDGDKGTLRKDGEPVKLLAPVTDIEVGLPITMILEGLGDLPLTYRVTTPVVLVTEE